MTDDDAILIAVDKPAPGIVAARLAGALDESTCARLLRVISRQVHTSSVATGGKLRAVVVDLGPLSRIDADGLRELARAEDLTRRCGVQLVITGLTAHRHALPGAVVEALQTFTELDDLTDLDACDPGGDALDVDAHPATVGTKDLALAS